MSEAYTQTIICAATFVFATVIIMFSLYSKIVVLTNAGNVSIGSGDTVSPLQPDLLEMRAIHRGGYDGQQQFTTEGPITIVSVLYTLSRKKNLSK